VFTAIDCDSAEDCELITHALTTSEASVIRNHTWYADSGATPHMTGHFEWFSVFKPIPEGQWPIRGIGPNPIYARGIGRINIDRKINNSWKPGSLDEVLFVPGLASNLFSLSRVATKGVDTLCTHDRCYLLAQNQVVMEGILEKMLYRLLIQVRVPDDYLYAASLGTSSKQDACQTLQTWHNRLSHINTSAIKTMVSTGIVDGIEIKTNDGDTFCEGCAKGKQHRNKFPINVDRVRASQPGQLIHTDICGPMSVQSIGGALYFAIFKDDCTCYRIVHCLTHKSDVQSSIKRIVLQVQRKTGFSVQILRSDRGKEFTSHETVQFLQDQNIRQELIVPYCLEQNGVTERDNRTIVEAARSMLHFRDVPLRFWAEAVQTATYILNRTYTRLRPDMTPYEAWFGIRPSLAHTRIFGCDAFIHVPKEKRHKLQAKSQPGMFLGYSDESKAYRVWNKTMRKVCITCDVLFHEDVASSSSQPTTPYVPLLSSVNILPSMPSTSAVSIQELPHDFCPSSSSSLEPALATAPIISRATPSASEAAPIVSRTGPSASEGAPITSRVAPNIFEAAPIVPRAVPTVSIVTPASRDRSQRVRKPVQYYGDWACLATVNSLPHIEPLTYKDAITDSTSAQWQ
jgi:hypothetical protein